MAKRYLETTFFKSPFVRGLEAPLKTLYLFIICDCEGSGIWSADFDIAGIYTGNKVSKSVFEKTFVEPGKAIDLKNGRYFFPDFIEHQYPKGLSLTNPAHSNFLDELIKYKLVEEKEKGTFKPLRRPSEGSYVTVKETVTVKAEVIQPPKIEKDIPTLDEFLAYYHSDLSKQFPNLDFQIQAKYEAWVENGWKDGNGKKVVNWKSKLKNTISFLKQNSVTAKNGTAASSKEPNTVRYYRTGFPNNVHQISLLLWKDLVESALPGTWTEVSRVYHPKDNG